MALFIYVVSVIIWTSHIVAGIFLHGSDYRTIGKILEASDAPIDLSIAKPYWIEQPVDQFNKSDARKWSMRYFKRTDTWRPGGPIYVYIGGEDEANEIYLIMGIVADLATETNGALFLSEHRYYGKSMPLHDGGTERLKYLSSRQALADLSRLIKMIKQDAIYKSSKVVVIGGSYAGNLATWMKLLYPDLVDAAWASSAPVLAKQDFYEYLETVTDVFEQFGGKQCADRIKAKFQRYSDLMKSEKGIETLKRENDICQKSNMSRPENQHLFTSLMADYFEYHVQYGSVREIQTICKNYSIDGSRTRMYIDGSDYSFWNREHSCLDVDYDEQVRELREGNSWMTMWMWQKCTEFSYAHTTSSDRQIFSKNMPLQAFYKLCVDCFGDDYGESNVARSVSRTNKMYGGLKPNVERVVFVNGEMDPWHRLGVLKDLSRDAPAKLVPRSSHCRDLVPAGDDDPKELVEAREFVKRTIKHWIGIETDDKNHLTN